MEERVKSALNLTDSFLKRLIENYGIENAIKTKCEYSEEDGNQFIIVYYDGEKIYNSIIFKNEDGYYIYDKITSFILGFWKGIERGKLWKG